MAENFEEPIVYEHQEDIDTLQELVDLFEENLFYAQKVGKDIDTRDIIVQIVKNQLKMMIHIVIIVGKILSSQKSKLQTIKHI